jgi:arylsulfatase A-like enzyme
MLRQILFPLLLTCYSLSGFAAEAPPNIVLIMCDDMGYSDIGCYGGEVMTPNLDRMAAEGMRFTQFYNNAKCTTTRASIVTGLYPRFNKQHLRRDMVTLGEAMGEAGYVTALCGKWHLGTNEVSHPYKRGFQSFYGLLDGCCNFFDPVQPDPPYKGGRVRKFAVNDQPLSVFPDDFYTTDAFTDHAVKVIKSASRDQKPFFVHVTYTAPHYPLHAKPKDIAKYRGKFKMGWDQMRQNRWQRMQEMGLTSDAWSFSEGDERSYDWESADHDFEDHRMAVYAAMIDCMDQNIGRILSTLKETGHDKDTLVMFLSDNGGCAEEPGGRDPSKRNPGPGDDYVAVGPAWGWAQNAPFRRYKSWLHEGGISTPLIAWWPEQIKPRTINRNPAHIIDLMPTFLELAGSEYPEEFNGVKILPVEGKSMVPLLHGAERPGHEQLAWFWSNNRALRQGNWKLVWDKLNPEKKWELYNLAEDRCEVNDLAATNPDRVSTMSDAWFAWADKVELKLKK